VVVDALAAHLAAFPTEERLIPIDGCTEPETVHVVFILAGGEPVARSRWSDIRRAAARPAGIPAGVGFHALRHYCASLLIGHGEGVKTVHDRLGHGSAVETLNTYAHLWPGGEDRTRAAVDSVLGAAVSPVCQAGDGQS
jgi:integrase